MVFKKQSGKSLFGYISALTLVTFSGFITIHSTRTGDTDSLLTLFLTAANFFYYLIHDRKLSVTYYLFVFIFITAAVMTKGIAGMLMLPAMMLHFLWFEKEKQKHILSFPFIGGLFFFLATVTAFYLYREYLTPGYLQAVWENELGGRYNNTIESHKGDFLFYVNRLVNDTATFWLPFSQLGIAVGLFAKNTALRKLTIFFLIQAIGYLLIISFSKTKTYWYDIPLYPILAIFTGISLHYLFEKVKSIRSLNTDFHVNFWPYFLVIALFFIPYRSIYKQVARKGEPDYYVEDFFAASKYLKKSIKENKNLHNHTVVCDDFYGHLLPYKYMMQDREQKLHIKTSDSLTTGETVISSLPKINEKIESRFYITQVDSSVNRVKIYTLGNVKTE